jgi:hypothetical protein
MALRVDRIGCKVVDGALAQMPAVNAGQQQQHSSASRAHSAQGGSESSVMRRDVLSLCKANATCDIFVVDWCDPAFCVVLCLCVSLCMSVSVSLACVCVFVCVCVCVCVSVSVSVVLCAVLVCTCL